jgi:HEAT repeat protein
MSASTKTSGKKNGGQFKPGTSGNPAGRPKLPEELKMRLRELAPAAVDALSELLQSEDPRIRLQAATALLDRGYGKPSQEIALDHANMMSPEQFAKLAEMNDLLRTMKQRREKNVREHGQ